MKGFALLFKLILAHAAKRWVRTLISLAGVAVSVALVIWIVRGYQAVTSNSVKTDAPPARFDVVVSPPMPKMMPGRTAQNASGEQPRRPPQGESATKVVAPALIEELAKDKGVSELSPRYQSRVRVIDPEPVTPMGPFGGGTLVALGDREPPMPLAKGRWLDATNRDELVVSSSFAERYGLTVGDAATIGGFGKELQLVVVGVLKTVGGGSPMGSPLSGDMYAAWGTAAVINGFEGRINSVCLALKDPEAADEFVKAWTTRTAALTPPVSIRSLHQKEDDPMGGRMIGMIKLQANNAAALAFLAACFIIFTTLNSGMRQRLREFAALRAIAMSRSQVVASVFVEAFLFALIGWCVGVALAKAFLKLGTALAVHMKFFQAGAFSDFPLGKLGLLVSAASAVAGAMAAAVVPAWRAARIKPVDILGAQEVSAATRFPRLMVAIGLVLVAANPLMVLAANTEPFKTWFAKTYTRGFAPPLLGSVAMIIGLALVTPLLIRVVEVVVGPVVAWALRLNPRFLRQQLSANLWRTVGTTISLSTGLSLFVTALVWGYSMLVPFTPDMSLPRMLVSILPAGIPESAVGEIEKVPGVMVGECLPLAVEQPRLSEDMLRSKAFASVDESQQHLLFMGLDPTKALGGDHPTLNLKFVEGDKTEAIAKLARGHYCLVPDHFKTQTGMEVGDHFSVVAPGSGGKTLDYEIAGVVYVPGWHWFTKFSEIRRRSGRALAMVFADYRQVKSDYNLDRISFFWLNADAAVGAQEMEKRIATVANLHAGVKTDIPGVGEAMVNQQYVKITERSDLVGRLNKRADDVIWSLTQFPLLVLVIASLAVFNAVFASVHARFWQYGVLRGVGMTRGQLARLIVSESLMIFLVAGVLSLGGGTLLAWCGTHICTYFFYFGGMTPPLVMPWLALSLGFGIAFGLCLLAGLIPAVVMAGKEPLKFIQAGRTSL
jgi:putative ABC transport system permease protein